MSAARPAIWAAALWLAAAIGAPAQEFNSGSPLVLGPIEESPLELGPEGEAGDSPLAFDEVGDESPLTLGPENSTTATIDIPAETGSGAVVRALDKLSGKHADLEIAPGGHARFGRIDVMLGECRYPAENPEGDAFAYLEIRDEDADAPAFAGWMIASSPALNALDHRRYDVWVIRCTTS